MITASEKHLMPAYVLHSRAYANNSLLLDLFCLLFGRVSCIARGVKKKGQGTAALQPFTPLLVALSGRGEVKTLTGFDAVQSGYGLQDKKLFCGFYLNELLLKSLPRLQPYETLFALYADTLRRLAEPGENAEVCLREFEIRLLDELGYGLQMQQEAVSGEAIEAGRRYFYDFERGPIRHGSDGNATVSSGLPEISGETLLALAAGRLQLPLHLNEAKRLTRYLLKHLLNGYEFKSRAFFSNRFSS